MQRNDDACTTYLSFNSIKALAIKRKAAKCPNREKLNHDFKYLICFLFLIMSLMDSI